MDPLTNLPFLGSRSRWVGKEGGIKRWAPFFDPPLLTIYIYIYIYIYKVKKYVLVDFFFKGLRRCAFCEVLDNFKRFIAYLRQVEQASITNQ